MVFQLAYIFYNFHIMNHIIGPMIPTSMEIILSSCQKPIKPQ